VNRDDAPLPANWRRSPLRMIAEINPRRPAGLDRSDDAPTTFVPMAAVDELHGAISRSEVKPFRDVTKGYTYFAEGDVLFAKITPCMQNGKHAIGRGLAGGIGFASTEFHVIRPGQEVAAEWIHFLIRQPHILRAAMAHFTGAVGQQRVPPEFLAKNRQTPGMRS
jgi:type I restriction enzyme, S subunit